MRKSIYFALILIEESLSYKNQRKKINIDDLENAFKIFKINKESKKSKEDIMEEDETWKSLYN